ncbi:hypothetical protein PtA15_10A433 [Puccinia triticina]|uniref:Uncharacterized protein n=1 Tax=Puccinia triticina TaxID=208348 RepID=A0ABY7CWH8_9BASI|nr:uncharacterized protein PtA15_10A433 [Puccinia triticina]WAQ89010.1 hypothetical protein PtA15_10A433 [Puccinia triticina]
MRAATYSTFSVYCTFYSSVLVLLSLIIGQCFCLPMLGDLHGIHHTPTLSKGLGSEIHENPWSSLSVKELGSTISGQRAGPDGGRSSIQRVPGAILMADSDLVSALKNEVLKPLRKLSEHEIAGFTPQATKALSLQTDYLDTIVRGYMDQSPTNPNQPGNLENSVRDADLRRSEGDQIASDFDRPGWHGLERSHISSQISAYERAPKPVVTHVTKGFPQAFMIATQPGLLEPVVSQPKQNIAELMSILANLIGSISSMVRFLARYHISEALNEEGVIPRHMKDPLQLSWLEEFDETIVLFSATLKSVYLESGQTMQKLDSFSEINQSIPMIYLTDIVNTPPWIFTARNFGYSVGAKEKEAAFKDFPQLEHFGKMVENISKISHATAKLEPRDRIGVLQKVLLHPENFINA